MESDKKIHQEMTESEDFEELEGGDFANSTGVVGSRVVKVLGDSDVNWSKAVSMLDPEEPGFSKEERVERVEGFTESQAGRKYSAPEIIHSSDESIELEYLDQAEDLLEYVQDESGEFAKSIGREVGEALSDMHSNGWSYRDFNTGNVMVEPAPYSDEEHRIYFTDPELSKDDPKIQDRIMSLAAFTYVYRDSERENSDELVEGFHSGYGSGYPLESLSEAAAELKTNFVDLPRETLSKFSRPL